MELNISSQIREAINGSSPQQLKYVLDEGYNITVTIAPTGNCQIYSIGHVDKIMTYPNWYDIIAFCHSKIMKRQLLIDVHKAHGLKIEEKFRGKILMKHEYSNTTYNTAMTLYLLDTSNLSEKVRKYLTTSKW